MDSFRNDEEANLLTINSILMAGVPIKLSANRTYFYSDDHTDWTAIPDLRIEVSVNDHTLGTLTYDFEKKLFVSDYIPKAGDKIEFHTQYMGKEVSAYDIVPSPVEIEEMKASVSGPVSNGWNKYYVVRYELTFTDSPDSEDFYYLRFDEDYSPLGIMKGTPGYKQELVFQILADQLKAQLPDWTPYGYYGLPFSDKGIEGKRHTLVITENVNWRPDMSHYEEMVREFTLYSVSPDYYRYLISFLCSQEAEESGIQGGMIDLGLAEPLKVFSNISGGVGIVGSCNPFTVKRDFIHLFRESPRSQ